MSATPDNSKRSGSGQAATLLIVGLLLLPVLYFLSVGPVILYLQRTGADPAFFETMYYPLTWLHANFPTLQPWIEAYAELWN